MSVSSLRRVERALLSAKKRRGRSRPTYLVPGLWSDPKRRRKTVRVDPFDFYLHSVRRVIRVKGVPRKRSEGGEWTRRASVYNMFVRTTTAFDHNGNGRLDLPLNADGWRETGTFLKAIALLPYLRSLGINTIHLLPVTSIGHDGNKGTLGSPYAIRNPYALDENLAEPILDLDAGTQFSAFVDASHRFGFRVVVEFVFRTAAKDSDWVTEHPEWFYWIREGVENRHPGSADHEGYGSPHFTTEELRQIKDAVRAGRMGDLIPPHDAYRELFRQPPPQDGVHRVDGRYVGTLPDGQRVRIPGAFADWPPDDSQPPWDDVTYLKMYDHPDFNYMAYNTIRMYDTRLTGWTAVNSPLWEHIEGIIPFYQREFGIDGVMIDMGHALPLPLKRNIICSARSGDRDFAFWDEDFSIHQKTRDEGYNAVVGYLWMDEHYPERMRAFFKHCASSGYPISFFGAAETHNTPRAAARPGGALFARWSWVINSFIPAIPFLHSGFELGETLPINTGLDFSASDLAKLPSERLPLFSEHAYDWARRGKGFPDFIGRIATIRSKYVRLVTDPDPSSFRVLEDHNPMILAFERSSMRGRKRIAIVTNADFSEAHSTTVDLQSRRTSAHDLLGKKRVPLRKGYLRKRLKPGECLVLEL